MPHFLTEGQIRRSAKRGGLQTYWPCNLSSSRAAEKLMKGTVLTLTGGAQGGWRVIPQRERSLVQFPVRASKRKLINVSLSHRCLAPPFSVPSPPSKNKSLFSKNGAVLSTKMHKLLYIILRVRLSSSFPGPWTQAQPPDCGFLKAPLDSQ